MPVRLGHRRHRDGQWQGAARQRPVWPEAALASAGGGSGTYRNAQPIVSRHKAADSSGTWLLVIFLALLVIPTVAVTAVPKLRNRGRPTPA